MTKLAPWISAGVFSLAATLASAQLSPVPTDGPGKPAALDSSCCDSCAPVCDPCCNAKAVKTKTVCASPRVIVHQAQPIVEFRSDGPTNVVERRKCVEDRAVRPVGGEGLFHHDCGCGGGFLKTKTHSVFTGMSAAPLQFAPQTTTAMVATPIQIQAFVPQTVQTFAVAPQSFVAQSFVAPQAVFGAQSFVAPQSVSTFNVGSAGFGASSADLNTIRALADVFSAAANAPATGTRALSNGNAQVQAATDGKINTLADKVDQIDARLLRVERKLNALCNTP